MRGGDAYDILFSLPIEVVSTGPYSVFVPLARTSSIPKEDTLAVLFTCFFCANYLHV